MLKDTVRTESYRRAIQAPGIVEGKVVLDVGCGTGILSMFAASAGALRVYAVDCAEVIEQARQIVKDNHLDGVITLIRGRVEDIEIPEKVDVLVSEWMGYFLMYESMLKSVIFARDKWLKPGGLVLPDRCSLYINAIEDEEYKVSSLLPQPWSFSPPFTHSLSQKGVEDPLVEERLWIRHELHREDRTG